MEVFGGALSFDEDLLDEIFINNAEDEDCLQSFIIIMVRPASNHHWEEIIAAVKKVENL